MKKLIIIIVVTFVTTFSGKSQTNVYHAFPDSAYWRVDFHHFTPVQVIKNYKYYYHYFMSGDTLINSINYKKINRSYMQLELLGWDSIMAGNPPTSVPGGYVGALRDDPIANKTYFVFSGTNTDTLLYDYNLTVGDTVKGIFLWSYPWHIMVVMSVDSVLIRGQYRKRWNFSQCNNSMGGTYVYPYIIEGVGASTGLIEPLCTYAIDFNNRFLVCVKDSSGILFTSSYNSPYDCNLITGYDDIKETNKFIIYPNPFSTTTTIKTNKIFNKSTLVLYNSLGQNVKQLENISGQNIIIDRGNLPCGLYFLMLKEENEIFVEKLIITN